MLQTLPVTIREAGSVVMASPPGLVFSRPFVWSDMAAEELKRNGFLALPNRGWEVFPLDPPTERQVGARYYLEIFDGSLHCDPAESLHALTRTGRIVPTIFDLLYVAAFCAAWPTQIRELYTPGAVRGGRTTFYGVLRRRKWQWQPVLTRCQGLAQIRHYLGLRLADPEPAS